MGLQAGNSRNPKSRNIVPCPGVRPHIAASVLPLLPPCIVTAHLGRTKWSVGFIAEVQWLAMAARGQVPCTTGAGQLKTQFGRGSVQHVIELFVDSGLWVADNENGSPNISNTDKRHHRNKRAKEGPYQDRPLLCPFRLSPLLTCS